MKKQSKFVALMMLAYVLVGLVAALAISDEFDQERASFLGFFAVPLATMVIGPTFFYPDVRVKYPYTFWWGAVLMTLSFSWGYVLLLNAVSEDQEGVVVATRVDPRQVLDFDQKRGGLGHLYRWRM